MNIFIVADNDQDSPQMMAPSLSQFFESHLGWESESEVMQVGKQLGIDLAPFLNFTEKENIENAQWQDLNAVLYLTQKFIGKLKDDPKLHERIHYSAMPQSHLQEQLLKLTLNGDKKGIAKFVKEWQHIPDSHFPPEIGYVRRGFLLEDLIALEKMLRGMMKDGASRIQLHYY
jgi:hypothetical protein